MTLTDVAAVNSTQGRLAPAQAEPSSWEDSGVRTSDSEVVRAQGAVASQADRAKPDQAPPGQSLDDQRSAVGGPPPHPTGGIRLHRRRRRGGDQPAPRTGPLPEFGVLSLGPARRVQR